MTMSRELNSVVGLAVTGTLAFCALVGCQPQNTDQGGATPLEQQKLEQQKQKDLEFNEIKRLESLATNGIPSKDDIESVARYYGKKMNSGAVCSLYGKAAKNGIVSAQRELGVAYEKGSFCQSNPKLAFEWLSKAARQKDTDAMVHLAFAHINGIGTSRNKAKGMGLLDEAAKLGSRWARDNIQSLKIEATAAATTNAQPQIGGFMQNCPDAPPPGFKNYCSSAAGELRAMALIGRCLSLREDTFTRNAPVIESECMTLPKGLNVQYADQVGIRGTHHKWISILFIHNNELQSGWIYTGDTTYWK